MIDRQPPCPTHRDSERFIRSDWAKSAAIAAPPAGGPVLMDRYFVSTVAYILSQRRAPPVAATLRAEVDRLYRHAHPPDLWIFLDEEPRASFARARRVRRQGMTGEWGTLGGIRRQRELALGLLEVLRAQGRGRVEVLSSRTVHATPEILLRLIPSAFQRIAS